MAASIVLDQEHLEHIAMLLSYSKDIPNDYGRAMFNEITRLRTALEKIRDNENCHFEWSDEVLRRLPDVTFFIVTEARRQSDIARKALEGRE
jgi:hypothetical protein